MWKIGRFLCIKLLDKFCWYLIWEKQRKVIENFAGTSNSAHLIFLFTQISYLVLFISFFSGLVLFFYFPIKTFCCFSPNQFTFSIFIFFSKRTKGIFSIQRSLYGWTKIIFLPIFKILHPHLVQCKENLATTLWFKYCEVDKKFLINWS